MELGHFAEGGDWSTYSIGQLADNRLGKDR